MDGGRERLSAGLVAAVLVGVWMLLAPVGATPAAGPPSLGSVWPRAARAVVPGVAPDGAAYTPDYLLGLRSSVGHAPTPDGAAQRLLLVAAGQPVRELRRLPTREVPRFHGFVSADGWLAWAETTQSATAMWTLRLDAPDPARRIVADAGDVRPSASAHELAIAGGRLHWTATGAGTTTELRSVALGGGTQRVGSEPGAWLPVAWPWLVSAGTAVSGSGPIRLLDPVERVTRQFVPAPTEVPDCGPTWCRTVVLGGAGMGRIDLVRVDGSQRREIAAENAGSPLTDVALLDRFEVLTSFTARAGAGRPLSLYDLAAGTEVSVAADAVTVASRGDFLWWSTGTADLTWHTLDLRSLS